MNIKRLLASMAVGFATLVAGVAVAQPAQAVDVSVCTIKPNYPHPSTHVNGTINTVGTVSCDRNMGAIFLRTTLVKANGSQWAGSVFDQINVRTAQSNAATSCSQGPGGNFRNATYYSIVFPPPLQPQNASGWTYSPWVPAICGGQIAVAPDEVEKTLTINWSTGMVADSTPAK